MTQENQNKGTDPLKKEQAKKYWEKKQSENIQRAAEKIEMAKREDTVVLYAKTPEMKLLLELLMASDDLMVKVREQSFSRTSRLNPERSMNIIKSFETIQDAVYDHNKRTAKILNEKYYPPFQYKVAAGLFQPKTNNPKNSGKVTTLHTVPANTQDSKEVAAPAPGKKDKAVAIKSDLPAAVNS